MKRFDPGRGIRRSSGAHGWSNTLMRTPRHAEMASTLVGTAPNRPSGPYRIPIPLSIFVDESTSPAGFDRRVHVLLRSHLERAAGGT